MEILKVKPQNHWRLSVLCCSCRADHKYQCPHHITREDFESLQYGEKKAIVKQCRATDNVPVGRYSNRSLDVWFRRHSALYKGNGVRHDLVAYKERSYLGYGDTSADSFRVPCKHIPTPEVCDLQYFCRSIRRSAKLRKANDLSSVFISSKCA